MPPVADLSRGQSDFWTFGTSLFTNAWGGDAGPARLRIKGVSWFGMETSTCHPGGLWHRPLEDYAAFLREHGFNAVRIPLAADAITSLLDHPCMALGEHNMAARGNNPNLVGVSYVDELAAFVQLLGEQGILVLLDMHVVSAGKWPDGGGVDADGEAQLRAAWEVVAKRLCDPHEYWNVFAADLKNEPYSMFWGKPAAGAPSGAYPPSMRWDSLAQRLANVVHGACPRWLAVVQGVGHCRQQGGGEKCAWPSAPGHQNVDINTWWGENLQGAQSYPLQSGAAVGLPERAGKVVYSPHTYGPATYDQPQFHDPDFPNNQPGIWDVQWGHLVRDGIAPVLLGEFGGRYSGSDKVLQDELVRYLGERGIGSFYWSLNPDSSDTGGLLREWSSMDPEDAKLALLARLPATVVPKAVDRAKPPPLPPPPPRPAPPPPSPQGPLPLSPPLPPGADDVEYAALPHDDEVPTGVPVHMEDREVGGATQLILGDGASGRPADDGASANQTQVRLALAALLIVGLPLAMWCWAPACSGGDQASKASLMTRSQSVAPRPKPAKRPSRRSRQKLPTHDIDEESSDDDPEVGRRKRRSSRTSR